MGFLAVSWMESADYVLVVLADTRFWLYRTEVTPNAANTANTGETDVRTPSARVLCTVYRVSPSEIERDRAVLRA